MEKVVELAVRKVVYDRKRTYVRKYQEQIKLAARWLTDPSMSGLYLCGVVGCGKTTLMNAISMVVLAYLSMPDTDPKTKDEFNFIGYAANKLSQMLADKTEIERIRYLLSDTCILGIDDLGTEPLEIMKYGNIVRPMVNLLSHRYEIRAKTVITSNLSPNQIEERYGLRLADRFREEYIIASFPNGSFRVSGITG